MTRTFPWASTLAITLAALALVAAMAAVYAGPFAPAQPTGVTLGEIAGDIRASALRALRGEAQPAPIAQPWDIDRILAVAIAATAVAALVSAVIGFIRHENRRAVFAGAALAIGAVSFQFLTWFVLIVIGALLIMGIMAMVGSVFE